ncbi:DUF5780 domain-containing protein [Paenibacillus elgii]
MATVKQEFKANKIEFQKATTTVETIKKVGLLKEDAESALSEINKLNDSRTSFKNSGEYKTNVLKEAEQLSSNTDYNKAIGLLNEALTILPKDSDMTAKLSSYGKLNEEKKAAERKQKMAELEQSQEVSVEKIRTFTDWLDDTYLSIAVKNNTSKVVKKYVVGWLGYDKNGYPVKTGWLSPDFLKQGNSEENIQPGKIGGGDSGWQLTGGFNKGTDGVTFKASVKEVEYYDGSKWEYPYYRDGGVDLSPLTGLVKQQGRELPKFLGADERIYTKPPTADLLDDKPGLLEEDDLGITTKS